MKKKASGGRVNNKKSILRATRNAVFCTVAQKQMNKFSTTFISEIDRVRVMFSSDK